MTIDLLPVNMIDPADGTDGQTIILSGGQFTIGDAGGGVSAVGVYVTTPEAHGAVGDGITDDTAAFLAAIAAIVAAGGGILLLGAKTYLVNGALDTSQYGNAIIALPAGSRVPIAIVGVQPTLQCDPRTDTGYSIIKTTKTGLTVGANGVPSVIGGPTVDTHWVEDHVVIANVQVWAPHDPTIAGVDLRYVRRLTWTGANCVALNVGDADFVLPTHVWAFGLRTPDSLNYNTVEITKGAASGFYAGLVGTAESSTIVYWSSKWCVLGWAPGTGGHAAAVVKISIEWCKYHVGGWTESAGVTNVANSHTGDTKALLSVLNLDLEDAPTAGSPWYATVEHIHDPTNKLYGKVTYNRTVSGVGPTTGLTLNGATNLLLDCLASPTRATALAVKDEGVSIDAAVSSVDFVGPNVAATTDGSGHVTVTVTTPASATTALVPMVSQIGTGDPDLVWTDAGELLLVEVPL